MRRPVSGPDPDAPHPWLRLSDDDLLFRIEALGDGPHDEDESLMTVVRSDRHFFIRQEAATRIRDTERLKAYDADRHIGQVLVRVMRRVEDVEYLRKLVAESRHLEVRKAAEAQLLVVERERKKDESGP
jgi:hypothetical protein